ncbi:DoxX family protein [Actinosynnema sp. NPDC059335]|uniref:DoxX family protein n=1 Tax=Actinosynnema sp. NPDC059335 TaxID=3346804 RepID=UPI00366C83D7
MNVVLWIVTALLATAYLAGGVVKVVVPKGKIAAAGRSGQWVEDWGAGAVKAIGVLEVLGAVGLVLPAVLGVAPVLVPIAAVGLMGVMAGATVVRVRRGEFGLAVLDLAYLVLLAFVAWGRLFVEPFTG